MIQLHELLNAIKMTSHNKNCVVIILKTKIKSQCNYEYAKSELILLIPSYFE